MTEVDGVLSMEFPRSKEQMLLLLQRFNALVSQDVDPRTNTELHYLSRLLSSLDSSQREFLERQKQLKSVRQKQSKGLAAAVKAFQLLSRGVDLDADTQMEMLDLSGIKARDASSLPPTPRSAAALETTLRNRVSLRLAELESLSANLGTFDANEVNFLPPDEVSDVNDLLKIKAVVELKQLRLLTKQKSLRQHVVYNLAGQENTSATSQHARLFNRRVKVQTAQDLQLTDHLEKQQRMERAKTEQQARLRYSSFAISHAQQVVQESNQRQARHGMLIKSVLQAHAQIEREEAKKAERTAKQRLLALRSNDEEAYIKLLDQTKDTRITHLLRQTNSFLDSLAQAVKVQQAETGLAQPVEPDITDGDKIDYYEVAHRIKEEITTQPNMLIGGQLKEYQIKGLQWMVSLVNNNLNGILADEMGLGKTIQSISLISYLIERKHISGPFLVIVPLSTITNWNVEFDKWAPSIKKIVYKGPPLARKSMQNSIRLGEFQVLLTTYEYIIKDRPLLSKIKWEHMIIDEGHRMKNTQSKLSYTLSQYYNTRFRLILTGTPLQNNLPELWALLNFVLPKIFNSVKSFDEWFNTPFANAGGQDRIELTEEESLLIIRRLHKVLRPFLLRRLKKDVEKDLPDKVEKVIKCRMSALQAKLYEHMLQHNVLYVGAQSESGYNKTGVKGLKNRIMQLRKICNHPFVFEEVENLINPTHINDRQLWRTAGKFELLDRILPKFQATGHRVLLFFQMTQVMNIMEDFLRLRGMQYLRLDGATKADERSEMLLEFNRPNSPYFCFLLSTRAGGLGLNLQTADTVIIFDTDWNPFQDLQAQDRAHRIGQTKEVRILRLITADSVEEAILDRALSKLEIDGKVIQAGKFDNKSTSEEQEAFLRSLMEAEELRRDSKDDDDEFDDEELNEILARSDDEHKLFSQMDEERKVQDNGVERLFSTNELPEIYKEDITPHLVEPVEVLQRRERRRVVYSDGLTDDQWVRSMEDDGSKKSRSKRAERADAEESENKKMKLEDILSPDERAALTNRMNTIINQLHTQYVDGEYPRYRTAIFAEIPSRKLYPDYFHVIKNPISLAEIGDRIDNAAYMSIDEFRSDLTVMFDNARTYNPPGSFVYEDAEILEAVLHEALSTTE